MPIFRIKSVKTYTGQKNLHEYIRGVRDKYQVWVTIALFILFKTSRYNNLWSTMNSRHVSQAMLAATYTTTCNM